MLADSFLVELRDGVPVAHGLGLHKNRFFEGLQFLGLDDHPTSFWMQGIREIAEYVLAEGASFPRFECWASEAGLRLHVSVRPAPARTEHIPMTVARTPVDSPQAALKGPYIGLYSELMREHGTEVLLTNHEGIALEGTTTALMWWEQDTLMTVAPQHARVASVTEALVLDIARELGYATQTATRTAEELFAHELWGVNALHGIRPVAPNASERLCRFRERYAARARPL